MIWDHCNRCLKMSPSSPSAAQVLAVIYQSLSNGENNDVFDTCAQFR